MPISLRSRRWAADIAQRRGDSARAASVVEVAGPNCGLHPARVLYREQHPRGLCDAKGETLHLIEKANSLMCY